MPIDERTELAELILYAIPGGDLAEACREFWRRVEDGDVTTVAQTYPPHCTLTGFFQRSLPRVARVLEDVRAAAPEAVIPAGAVTGRLEVTDTWVGLVLDAPPFAGVIDRFATLHSAEAGEDAVRPKSWMHLSLAYGAGLAPETHGALAADLFADVAPSPWTVGLWRRGSDGTWVSERARPA